tara:strand:- start:9083 stop:9811 length:729 start_codon:yes stop_codon:yes gene_type:complete
MAISVDTVYQKVLALANKEQRGYISPQDFNLFADQAQMEIFEQYFYDLNIARKSQGNDTIYANVDDMLEEKLQIFERTPTSIAINNYTSSATDPNAKILPTIIWRVHRIELEDGVECEILNTKDFHNCLHGGPLLRPSKTRPIANIRNNIMRCVSSKNKTVVPVKIIYFKKPAKVNWTYVVVNKQALYNANSSTVDFELHPAEENQLVNKILRLAGVSIKQPDVIQAGHTMDMTTIQQQPKI